MTRWQRFKAWCVKHAVWLWSALGVLVAALLALVLRPKPPLPAPYRDPLELKQQELREAEALGAAKARVDALKAEIEEIEERREAITDRNLGRVNRIDQANGFEELERIRQEQNAEIERLTTRDSDPTP